MCPIPYYDFMRHSQDKKLLRYAMVRYAQDHGGYLLRPEDWLSGGYEPSISFWGPLEGEYVAEQTAAVMAMAMTPEREDGNALGIAHAVVPRVAFDIPLDTTMNVGTVPMIMPEYLLAHRFQTGRGAEGFHRPADRGREALQRGHG